MVFSRRGKRVSTTGKVQTLHPKDIGVSDNIVTLGPDKSFNVRDVIVASVNHDTVKGDGIGGSVVVKTREYEPVSGVVQKVYQATFDEAAVEKMDEVADKIKGFGVTVRTLTLNDRAFRKAFFQEAD